MPSDIPLIVVITGDPNWADAEPIERALEYASGLIIGDHETGAEAIAASIAAARGLSVKVRPVVSARRTVADEAQIAVEIGLRVECYSFGARDALGAYVVPHLLNRVHV